MKKYLFLLLPLFCYQGLYACSFSQTSFCQTLHQFDERTILTGKIVSIDTLGIDFAVIDVLRGIEDRDTVRIWDGTDFDCNGLFSLAAEYIGELDDTLILILPTITAIENEWDVIGDYRRGDPHFYASELQVSAGEVRGFIKGSIGAPPEYLLLEYPYAEFKDGIINSGDCATIVNTHAPTTPHTSITFNNPFSAQLQIQLPDETAFDELFLYSSSGALVYSSFIKHERALSLSLSHLPAGLYFLELRGKARRREVRKVVKL